MSSPPTAGPSTSSPPQRRPTLTLLPPQSPQHLTVDTTLSPPSSSDGGGSHSRSPSPSPRGSFQSSSSGSHHHHSRSHSSSSQTDYSYAPSFSPTHRTLPSGSSSLTLGGSDGLSRSTSSTTRRGSWGSTTWLRPQKSPPPEELSMELPPLRKPDAILEHPPTPPVGQATFGPVELRLESSTASTRSRPSREEQERRGGGRKGKGRAREEPTTGESVKALAKSNWLNLLLVFIPVSWALNFAGLGDTIVFVTSFLAIIPLASLLGFATEELEKRAGPTLGGLVNASFGNVVELIVAILALFKCELQVVLSSLLGSVLSNLLLVLGTSFLVGGLKFSHLSFRTSSVRVAGSLLLLATVAVLLPVGFHTAFDADIPDPTERPDLLSISRGTAVLLLGIYLCYLAQQLWTHKYLYDATPDARAFPPQDGLRMLGTQLMVPPPSFRTEKADMEAFPSGSDAGLDDDEEEEDAAELNLLVIWATLAIVAGLVGYTSEILVASIQGFTQNAGVGVEFTGLILLPIIGNAAEHWSAVTAAWKGKPDLSLGIAVGSSIQISVFVIPLLVVIGWAAGRPLSLVFTSFEALALFVSTLVTTQIIHGGRANFLHGCVLLSCYVCIALAVWFYPTNLTSFFICE